MRIAIQADPFDPAEQMRGFGGPGTGAIVTFNGIVRDDTGQMQALELEHYPGMTERVVADLAEEARARWDLTDVLVIHRYGRFAVGDTIMMVAAAARHRTAAFAAAEFLMDHLKSRAPFWKKEIGPEGDAWVAAKTSDEDALNRW